MEYQTGKKYDTQNGFKADIRYLHNGCLCGHVITDCTPAGFCMMHWTLDGFVLGADQGFDLIHPETPTTAQKIELSSGDMFSPLDGFGSIKMRT